MYILMFSASQEERLLSSYSKRPSQIVGNILVPFFSIPRLQTVYPEPKFVTFSTKPSKYIIFENNNFHTNKKYLTYKIEYQKWTTMP